MSQFLYFHFPDIKTVLACDNEDGMSCMSPLNPILESVNPISSIIRDIDPLKSVAKPTGNTSIYDIVLIDPGVTTDEEAEINCIFETINRASASSPLGEMRNSLLTYSNLQITFTGSSLYPGGLQSPFTSLPLAAGTIPDIVDPDKYTIVVDIVRLKDPNLVTQVINAFATKISSWNNNSYSHTQMGSIIHELGHVWSAKAFPPSVQNPNNRPQSETDTQEAHSQRWEAHYYRHLYQMNINFSQNSYKYLNDWPNFFAGFTTNMKPY